VIRFDLSGCRVLIGIYRRKCRVWERRREWSGNRFSCRQGGGDWV